MAPISTWLKGRVLLYLAAILTPSANGVLPRATAKHDTSPYNDTLSWGPCSEYQVPYQCATFRVPMDYAYPSKGSLALSLIRLPASTSPRKGYMFYNPGGPGGSGVSFIGHQGKVLQGRLGSGWDILSWDPRGIGASEPDVPLFDTANEYDTFYSQLQGTGKYEAHGNVTQSSDVNFFRSQSNAFDSLLQQFDEKYRARSGEKLKYCAVVRDLVGMVDAIYGPRADVNFYGISYGSLLAAYLIQMFPHRVGKVIADGVLDAVTWSSIPSSKALSLDLKDAEAVLHGWSSACASSSRCLLSTLGNRTTEGVISIVDSVLNTAYKTYDGTVWSRMGLFVNATQPSDIHAWSYDILATVLYQFLYGSDAWLFLDRVTALLYTQQRNVTIASITSRSEIEISLPIRRVVSPVWSPSGRWTFSDSPWSQEAYAIACGDSMDTPWNYNTSTVFENVIKVSQNTTSHFGTTRSPRWFCHRWTTRAVERLQSNFDTKPKNVVLVIGNTLDPITPYASAKAMASKKRLGEKARLVQFNAIGHYTGSNNSTCIDNVIRSYVNGEVPLDKGDDGPDVVCEVDSTPFSTA